LDYYTKTVFEIYEKDLEIQRQGALAGGGRYDALVKLLGGKDTPASGAAAGIERIIEAMKAKTLKFEEPAKSQIYLAQLGILAKRKSLRLLEDFRKAKIPVSESFSKDLLRAQLKMADKIGVRYTLI